MEDVWSQLQTSSSTQIIGIDFGTSNCSVAFWNDSKKRSKIVKSEGGRKLIHSTVAFTREGFNFCEVGLCQNTSSAPLISSIKQHLGNTESIFCTNSDNVTTGMSPVVIASYLLKELRTMAEKYMIKKHLLIDAGSKATLSHLLAPLHKSEPQVLIHRAVIGVPVNFSEKSKRQLREAAHLAGLTEVHFLAECTAAALSYGLLCSGQKTVLVFDIGGGTTDVTIIRIDDGRFSVLVTAGNSQCGGAQLDSRILRHVLSKVAITLSSSHLVPPDTHTGNAMIAMVKIEDEIMKSAPVLYHKLIERCRDCKELLSVQDSVDVMITSEEMRELKHVISGTHVELSAAATSPFEKGKVDSNCIVIALSRSEFENICSDVIHAASNVASDALKPLNQSVLSSSSTEDTAAMQEEESSPYTTIIAKSSVPIDEVVLVGGSSRIPAIRAALRQALIAYEESAARSSASFARKWESFEFCTSVDPETAVAQGLAIRAAVLSGYSVGKLKDILTLDCLPFNIGLLSWSSDVSEEATSQQHRATSAHGIQRGKAAAICRDSFTREAGGRVFDAILRKGQPIPASGSKLFRVPNPDCQKRISLDVYEQVEEFQHSNDCNRSSEEGGEQHETEINRDTDKMRVVRRQRYELIGTYDFPIPFIPTFGTDLAASGCRLNNEQSTMRKASDKEDPGSATEEISAQAFVWTCYAEIWDTVCAVFVWVRNMILHMQSTLAPRRRIRSEWVRVTMNMDEDGCLAFSVDIPPVLSVVDKDEDAEISVAPVLPLSPSLSKDKLQNSAKPTAVAGAAEKEEMPLMEHDSMGRSSSSGNSLPVVNKQHTASTSAAAAKEPKEKAVSIEDNNTSTMLFIVIAFMIVLYLYVKMTFSDKLTK